MKAVTYPHIEVTSDGVPRISGTPTKVIDVVLDRLANNWDADEIHRQHPHLTLAQVYSALAYYHDHQSEIDRDIEEGLRRSEEIQARIAPSKITLKFHAMKAKR